MTCLLALALLLAAPVHRGRPPDFAVDQAHRDQLLAGIEQALQESYVFPERLEQILPALHARWQAAAFRKLDHAHALVDRINADLLEVVHDRHLTLRLAAAFPKAMLDEPDRPDPEQETMERKRHYGVLRAEILPGNVGLLALDAFASKGPGEEKAYAAALAFLEETDALILDLRDNGGGDGESVADLVGYLLDHKTLLQWDVERGGRKLEHYSAEHVAGPRYGEKRPVYVLTSPRTFSAAEECAYDLQTQKRAAVVGEPSGGGANHNRFVRVAGDFALSVPFMTTQNAVTGKNWEGTGVLPDVKAAAGDALRAAHALALEKLIAAEPEPRRKAFLQQLSAEVRSAKGGPGARIVVSE